MSEETVVRQCAPTLAGIKTGSLFPCPYDSREELLQDVRSLNKRLVPKGLCLLPTPLPAARSDERSRDGGAQRRGLSGQELRAVRRAAHAPPARGAGVSA